ncbi:MAG: hypothetical protein ABI877_02250, partial [Gemmatimonadaceae bacterium]
AALSVFFLVARQAEAQSNQRLSMQLSGIAAGLQGRAYAYLAPGVGGEAQLRYTIGALSFGAGLQYTRHNSALAGATFPIAISGPFLEPRYVLPTTLRDIGPYVSTRFSLLKQHYSLGGYEGSATGATLNGGGGALVRLTPRVNLDVGATFGFTAFRRLTIDNTETHKRTPLPAGSGTNVVVRIGLAFGLRG